MVSVFGYVQNAIVRIFDRDRRPIGAGCLVRDHLIVTCAHVVAAAVTHDREGPEAPTNPIEVDFPFIENGSSVRAKVVVWHPYRRTVTAERRHDIAVLELIDSPPSEAEPARLSKAGDDRTGPIWAYGFPAGAALGHLGDWLPGQIVPPLPNGWLKLLKARSEDGFIEPGCSGGPVIVEDTGLVRGIVSLRRERDERVEAFGISAPVLRDALPAIRIGPEVASRRRPEEDLRAVVARLLEAAQALGQSQNFSAQMAEEILRIGDMLQHCLGGDQLTPAVLGDLAVTNEDLADFAVRARREELDCFFEEAPLRGIIDRLDDVTSQIPVRTPGDDDIEIDHTATHRADIQAILELRREVEATQAKLEADRGRMVGSKYDEASRGLKQLMILLSKPRLSTRRLNECRRRLEAIKANLLDRTVRLTRVVLGHYAGRLPNGAVFQDREDAPEMVVIPAGRFLMGAPEDEAERLVNEGPQHPVEIRKRFALGRFPITFEEYDRFVDARGLPPPPDEGWGRDRMPVINVSWEDAKSYIAWLAERTDRDYRLPSEAEWEYGCRAGTTTRYSWGDEITPNNANFDVGKTTEVGAYSPNAWGLFDMHGNVEEWVEDAWHASYEGAPGDGSPWLGRDGEEEEGGDRVLRGGSWIFRRWFLRSAFRGGYSADFRDSFVGFRVARTLRS